MRRVYNAMHTHMDDLICKWLAHLQPVGEEADPQTPPQEAADAVRREDVLGRLLCVTVYDESVRYSKVMRVASVSIYVWSNGARTYLAVGDHFDAGLLAHLHHRQAVGERVRGEARCMCV